MLLLTKDTTLSFKGLLLWLGHAGIVRQSIWFMDTRLKRPVSASLFKMTPSTEGQVTLRPAAKRCYLKGTPRDVRLWVLMIEMRYIFWMYLWWNLSTLYLLPCQMSYHRWYRSVGYADKNEVYIYIFWMYLWQNLCTLYFTCIPLRVTTGNSGLCCCVCVVSFECWLTPFVCWWKQPNNVLQQFLCVWFTVKFVGTWNLCKSQQWAVPFLPHLWCHEHVWHTVYIMSPVNLLLLSIHKEWASPKKQKKTPS